MMQDGLFEKFPCDEVYGIHNMPGMETGHFGFLVGPSMASSNRFEIKVHGTGAHAATPENGVDPVFIAAEMVGSLQSLITRNKPAGSTAVLSITQIHAGDAYNVIPAEAIIRGTVRTFSTETLDMIEDNMRRIVTMLPQAYGATGELNFIRAYPCLVNHEAQTNFAADVAEEMVGAGMVRRSIKPFTGSEDFSFFLEKVPGSYLFLGNGGGEHRGYEAYEGMGPCELHNPNYDFNDALLPIGGSYWVKLVQAFFAKA
jgi:hippurate hydrolase